MSYLFIVFQVFILKKYCFLVPMVDVLFAEWLSKQVGVMSKTETLSPIASLLDTRHVRDEIGMDGLGSILFI